jgi:hypothetical protein
MQKNSTQLLQQYFFDYIHCEDIANKQNILNNCIKKLPEEKNLIYRIKNIVDELQTNAAISFINNVFDISKEVVRFDLMENIESQINNKTTVIDKVDVKKAKLISFYNFEKEETYEECKITKDKVMLNDNQERYIKQTSETDSYFYNYIVEMFLIDDESQMLMANTIDNNYVISNKPFPEISSSKLVKEDSIVDTKNIEYFIDRIIGDKEDKQKYLNRIFLDLLTNQNYRILGNGFGIINSDTKQNDYYVLNGITLKKEFAIECLYRNYYEEIQDISNLIIDNYDTILDLIVDLLKTNLVNNQYLVNLRNNVVKIFEKGRLNKSLNSLENEEEEVITEKRQNLNNIFEENVKKFRKSLNLDNQSLTKKGYASIFILVTSIIISGLSIAYLLVR